MLSGCTPWVCGQVVLHMIENFMDKVAERAAQVARHRSVSTPMQTAVGSLLESSPSSSPPLQLPPTTPRCSFGLGQVSGG